MPSEILPRPAASGILQPATHLVVREHPKAKRTKRQLETVTWPRSELGYSNIRLDDVETQKWAIRMVTSYGRYASLWMAVRD